MRKITIWDVPTRLFHWLAAALVAVAYATWQLGWMDWHVRIGYALLVLTVFRITWGFFGSETAQFRRFLASPCAAVQHLAHTLRREPDRWVGHNPAGGWMVMLLLALLLGETLTGVYINNDIANVGPLTELVPARMADFIDTLHAVFWETLLASVALHVLAIGVYWIVKRQNLVVPMITGGKTLSADILPPKIASSARALAILGVSTFVTAALVNFL